MVDTGRAALASLPLLQSMGIDLPIPPIIKTLMLKLPDATDLLVVIYKSTKKPATHA